jgi:hypothetical protein
MVGPLGGLRKTWNGLEEIGGRWKESNRPYVFAPFYKCVAVASAANLQRCGRTAEKIFYFFVDKLYKCTIL